MAVVKCEICGRRASSVSGICKACAAEEKTVKPKRKQQSRRVQRDYDYDSPLDNSHSSAPTNPFAVVLWIILLLVVIFFVIPFVWGIIKFIGFGLLLGKIFG